jgi:hypothetical protein
MKTYVEWFNELPEPYRTQALENVRGGGCAHSSRYDESEMFVSMAQAITSTIHWSATPQGHEYWNELYDRYTEQHREAMRIEEAIAEQKEEEARARARELYRIRDERVITFSESTRSMLRELSNHSVVASLMLFYSDKNLFCDYVTMRGEMFSYLPKGRPHMVNDSGRWAREGRQEMKPGKLARKILHEEDEARDVLYGKVTLTDKDFEQFGNMVRSYIGINGDEDGEGRTLTIDVFSGEDIRWGYYEDNYSQLADSGSNLWGSCMRYGSCQDYFDIYVENNVKMLVAKDTFGKIVGRALLWECTNGRKAMDTIYSPDKVRQVFINWAIDNDYYYKSQQSCHHHEFDMHSGESVGSWDAVVKLSHVVFSEYPYMDTFMYLNQDDKLLSNRDDDYTHTLRCTDGGYEENGVYDDFSDETISEEDAVYLDYCTDEVSWRGTTHIDNTVMTRDGYRVLDRDSVEVEGYYFAEGSDSIVYVDSRNEYYLVGNTTETYDGDIIHDDDALECAHTGNTYHRDDMVEVETYIFVHKDSVEDYLEQLKEEENV